MSDTVGSDILPPDRQTDLTHEQMVKKDYMVFESAGETLARSWSRMKVGGHPVRPLYPPRGIKAGLFTLIFSFP